MKMLNHFLSALSANSLAIAIVALGLAFIVAALQKRKR